MVKYRIAKTVKDINESKKLVLDTYKEEGYAIEQDDSQSNISDFIVKPITTTILCCENESVLGTISIVRDSSEGLPMDTIFKSELSDTRVNYPSLAELCQFAVDKSKSNQSISLGLLAHAIHILVSQEVECVCFAVNPKHETFYRALGAVQIGIEKTYPHANNAPALGFYLNLKILGQSDNTSPYARILKSIVPDEDFCKNYN